MSGKETHLLIIQARVLEEATMAAMVDNTKASNRTHERKGKTG